MKNSELIFISLILFSSFVNSSVVIVSSNTNSNNIGWNFENSANQQNINFDPAVDFSIFNSNLRTDQQNPKGESANTKPNDLISLRTFQRSFDGTNNGAQFNYGQSSTQNIRICSYNYKDGFPNVMRDDLPNPRVISNTVGNLPGSIPPNHDNLNMLFPIWGQFLDHDITLTKSGLTQQIPIPIPQGDQWLDSANTGTQSISVRRSSFNLNAYGFRTQINSNTAWVDASQIYGSDVTTANNLRTFVGGALKTSSGNLLPKNSNGFYFAGDARVNQNVGLTAIHTVFMREHNRICSQVLSKNSSLSDQQVYNIARTYVTALVQHITYDEFLPQLVGRGVYQSTIGQYKSTDDNPTISTQFTTSTYRLGHPTINAPFKLMSNDGGLIQQLSLGEMFSNPNLVTAITFPQILNGLIRVVSKQRSLQVVNDLRNFLMLASSGTTRLDLYSINIQRGRDHGVCSLQQMRQKLGLSARTFSQVFQDQDKANKLQSLYGSLDKVDLWLGIIGQKRFPNSNLGQLGNRIIADQFRKIRNGDKNWYQNILGPQLVNQIKKTTLGDVIKRNTVLTTVNARTFDKV